MGAETCITTAGDLEWFHRFIEGLWYILRMSVVDKMSRGTEGNQGDCFPYKYDVPELGWTTEPNMGSHCRNVSWDPVFMNHYNDVIMGAMASPITSLTIVYSTVYSGADQRKHQRSSSLALVRGIHRWFPTRRVGNAENVSIWWRHHGLKALPVVFTEHTLAQELNIASSWCVDGVAHKCSSKIDKEFHNHFNISVYW